MIIEIASIFTPRFFFPSSNLCVVQLASCCTLSSLFSSPLLLPNLALFLSLVIHESFLLAPVFYPMFGLCGGPKCQLWSESLNRLPLFLSLTLESFKISLRVHLILVLIHTKWIFPRNRQK